MIFYGQSIPFYQRYPILKDCASDFKKRISMIMDSIRVFMEVRCTKEKVKLKHAFKKVNHFNFKAEMMLYNVLNVYFSSQKVMFFHV